MKNAVLAFFALLGMFQTTAPDPPRNLTASVVGRSVTLVWSAAAGGAPADTYILEAGSAPGASNLANFRTGNLATSFSAVGVNDGTYYLRVRAANAAGTSAPSNEAIATVGSAVPCPGVPAPPTSLSASVAGSTVSLTWIAGVGPAAASFVIEAGSAPGAVNLANVDIGRASTSFSASGVGQGVYYVRVRARNACGTSAPSNEVVVTVGTPPRPITATHVIADGDPGALTGTLFYLMPDRTLTTIATTVGVPRGVTTDESGTIFVTIPFRQQVLRVTPDGSMATVFAGPPLRNPIDSVVDRTGHIIVGDNSTDTIYRITPDGRSITAVLNLPPTPANLQSMAIELDNAGNVIVASDDIGGNGVGSIVHRLDANGAVITVFNGTAIRSTSGLVVDAAGNYIIADFRQNTVFRLTPSGVVSTLASSGLLCCNLVGLASDPATGDFLSLLNFRDQIVRIRPNGTISTVHTGFPLTFPGGIAVSRRQ